MEGVLMDRTQVNSRSRVSSRGAVITRPRYMSLDPSSSNHHQLLPNHQPLKQQQQHDSFCGSLPPNYSPPLLQPPLLPLPPLRQRERMKPSSPAVAASSVHRRKLRLMNSKLEIMVVGAAAAEAGKRDQEEILMESPCVYSLSPPPSNLPLPSFLLTKQKT